MDPRQLIAYRRQLDARLAELAAADDALRDAHRPVVLDQQSVGRLSRMDAIQQQQMAIAAMTRRQAEARRLRAALRRMDQGDFGICGQCGDRIEPRRLHADPAIFLCISCMRP